MSVRTTVNRAASSACAARCSYRAAAGPSTLAIPHSTSAFSTTCTPSGPGSASKPVLPTRDWSIPSPAHNAGDAGGEFAFGRNGSRDRNRDRFGTGNRNRDNFSDEPRRVDNYDRRASHSRRTPAGRPRPDQRSSSGSERSFDGSALLKWGVSAQGSSQSGVKHDSSDRGDRRRDSRGPRAPPSGFGMKKPDTRRADLKQQPTESSANGGSEKITRVTGTLEVEDDGEIDADKGHHRNRAKGESSHSYKSLRLSAMGGEIALPGRDRSRTAKDKDRARRDTSHEFRAFDRADKRATDSGTKRGNSSKREVEKKVEKEVYIPSTVNVGRLADIFGVKLYNLQTRMMRMGLEEEQRRSDYLLTTEQSCDIALEYGFNPVVDDEKSFDILPQIETGNASTQPLRPPVVTIMGHVDHGKTTLLDALRHTSVAASEAGGITQHIGAFSVPLDSLLPGQASSGSSAASTITFLDTPGHAAFTAMRARGASVTDLVVLVVAADDGVMPQTKEVIELVKSEGEGVGLVVAINKCDKPGIDFTKVKSALGAEGILLEEDGGDVPSVRVSGLAKMGLDDLVETLSTLAEIRDLRARQDGQAEGFVLESRVDKGRGNVATVLVTRGTLHTGSIIVAGHTWARVRQMQDDRGRPVQLASPGTPVSLTGWRDVPSAGDQLLEAKDEDQAKRAISNRLREVERKKMLEDVEIINVKRKEERLKAEKEAAEQEAILAAGGTPQQAHAHNNERLHDQEEKDGFKELRLVIKGDVSGTVEAVVGSLQGIGNKEAGVKIISTGVGDVSESDVALAEAARATVIGFSVSCPRSITTQANTSSVPVHLESVIYRLIDTVRQKVAALLPPRIEIRVTGEAVVQQLFPIKVKRDVLMVAGCRVSNGIISKSEKVRLMRPVKGRETGDEEGNDREIIFEGNVETLKHLKKDVGEVRKGTECGISFEGFNDVREGDEVVSFTTIEVPREL